MYVDEYENREAFDRMYKPAEHQPDLLYSDDPGKAAHLRDGKRSLTFPGSSKDELWTEHSRGRCSDATSQSTLHRGPRIGFQ